MPIGEIVVRLIGSLLWKSGAVLVVASTLFMAGGLLGLPLFGWRQLLLLLGL